VTSGEEHLAELTRTLDRLDEIFGEANRHFERDLPASLAVQRLWMAAGECARRYCDAEGIDIGTEPWSSLWGYRNVLAHRLLSEISDRRVWEETAQDLKEYRGYLETLSGERR